MSTRAKKVIASLQQDPKKVGGKIGLVAEESDTAEMNLSSLKVHFENKCQDLTHANEQISLLKTLIYSVACPIRHRDINFSYRKEDQRNKEAVRGGKRAVHSPKFIADAILCYFECLEERGKDIATRIYGVPLEIHATSLKRLHRLIRRIRLVDWLNARVTIRSWMKEKMYNGTSKRAERFRELDEKLIDLSSSIADSHSEEDESNAAFETDPRVEKKKLRRIETTQERTRKPSH